MAKELQRRNLHVCIFPPLTARRLKPNRARPGAIGHRGARATVSEAQNPDPESPDRDPDEPPDRGHDDTPDTPPTEPPPVPVKDPPAEPGPVGPYVV